MSLTSPILQIGVFLAGDERGEDGTLNRLLGADGMGR
jgi:hypothetical protein